MNPYSPPAVVQNLVSWKIGQLGDLAREAVSDALRTERLRRNHSTIMMKLAETEPTSQADLARLLWIDPSDLHAVLNDLEGLGYVERVTDPADKRRKLVELLPDGELAVRRLSKQLAAAQESILDPLDPAEREQFSALLEKLLEDRWPPEDR